MTRLAAIFHCCLLLPLAPGDVAARDIFVNNVAGDDTYNGRNPLPGPEGAGPARTLAKALRIAEVGDRIELAKTGRPYRESISLSGARHRGDELRPFIIEGNGQVLDGSQPVPVEAWRHYHKQVFRFRPRRLDHQMLFRDDAPLTRRRGAVPPRQDPTLDPLEWDVRNPYIYFRAEDGKLPEDYNLSFAVRQTGVTIYHARHVLVRNLIVQGFRVDGVCVNDGVRRCLLENVTCRGNGRAGVSVAGSSHVTIRDSLLGNNGEVQLLLTGNSVTTLQNTHVLKQDVPDIIRKAPAEVK